MTNDTTPKRYTLEEMLDMADRLEHHMQPDNEAPADMLRQAAADRERAEQLEAALRSIQFGYNGYCPACNGWDMSDNGSTQGVHTKDCDVGRALLSGTAPAKPKLTRENIMDALSVGNSLGPHQTADYCGMTSSVIALLREHGIEAEEGR